MCQVGEIIRNLLKKALSYFRKVMMTSGGTKLPLGPNDSFALDVGIMIG